MTGEVPLSDTDQSNGGPGAPALSREPNTFLFVEADVGAVHGIQHWKENSVRSSQRIKKNQIKLGITKSPIRPKVRLNEWSNHQNEKLSTS